MILLLLYYVIYSFRIGKITDQILLNDPLFRNLLCAKMMLKHEVIEFGKSPKIPCDKQDHIHV